MVLFRGKLTKEELIDLVAITDVHHPPPLSSVQGSPHAWVAPLLILGSFPGGVS